MDELLPPLEYRRKSLEQKRDAQVRLAWDTRVNLEVLRAQEAGELNLTLPDGRSIRRTKADHERELEQQAENAMRGARRAQELLDALPATVTATVTTEEG